MSTITKLDIEYLFDELWPAMPYAKMHKHNCIEQFERIEKCFSIHSGNHNNLIQALASLDGIKVTIASGLIWSVNRTERVPFDKYTLNYALYQGIIRSNIVSKNYIRESDKIKAHCDSLEFEDGSDYTIEHFVREAMVEMMGKEALLNPE